MSVQNSATFNPKVMLALVLFGAIAFFATLYFIGSGQTGSGNDGGGHASGKGLNGYAALAQLLERDGYDVTLSRSPGALDDYTLMILTPSAFFDADELEEVVEKRRYEGPTIIVLPKWSASKIPAKWKVEKRDGWVVLGSANKPFWTDDLSGSFEMDVSIAPLEKSGPDWSGFGLSGLLPDRSQSMSLDGPKILPLVRNADGKALAGFVQDDGYYPVLEDAAGAPEFTDEDREVDKWGVIVVAEPDLLNNYGMADNDRAALARALVYTAMEEEDLSITFDLTQNGLGKTKNLLTLAFEPPFLAATLCLIIALLVVGWRAFRRFGPAVAEARPIAFGKRQLVANSARLIQRTKRLHLLSAPYADMMRARLVTSLGLRRADDAQLDAALGRRLSDEPPPSLQLNELRNARTRHELLRAAAALKSLERKLAR